MNPFRYLRAGLRSVTSAVASTLLSVAGYPSTDARRKATATLRPTAGTANQILPGALGLLVAQARHLERSTPWGRAICDGLVADVVGSGIGVMPNTGAAELDLDLLEQFNLWAEHACVDGRSLWAWQAMAMRELVAAGAGLARLVILPERAEAGEIPLAVLPLEVEWLAVMPVAPIAAGNSFVRGVELDQYGRPVAYHLQHPEQIGSQGERVPASAILHVYEQRRAQQTHGEPMLAPVIERILQDSRLVETELTASVATAAPAITIQTDRASSTVDDDSKPVDDIPAGSVVRLLPGEKAEALQNPRPSQQIAPFRGTIRGDLAAACRCSQYWLDRDAGRANYSSMRMDQLLSKRTLAPLKECLGEQTAGRLYRELVPWLMLALGRAMPTAAWAKRRLYRYELRPDQPEYVNPMQDIAASANAIAQNLSTYDQELSARGKDMAQVFRQRQRENALLAELGLPLPAVAKMTPNTPAVDAAGADGQPPDEQPQDQPVEDQQDQDAPKEAVA